MYSYNKKLVPAVQELRRNMTPEEKHLWYDLLVKLPVQAKRQKNLGHYIVDFYIPSAKLVIEIDGRQHLLSEHREADEKRDSDLAFLGIGVIRYTNQDIRERFIAVEEDILKRLGLTAQDLRKEE